jgi:exonuclease III
MTTKLSKEMRVKIENNPGICVGHLNTRSILPKIDDIKILLPTSMMDILTISETWLDESIQHEINVPGYNILRKDRNRHGGGVMMYIREGIDYTERHELGHSRVESVWIEVPNMVNREKTLICSYYRPPDKKTDYYDDTLDMINKAAEENKEMLICGDFNWDYKLDESLANNKVKHIEDLFLLNQIIDKPTRTENGDKILDLILTSNPTNHIYTDVLPLGCSDHYLPYTIINTNRPPQSHKQAVMRNYKNFDVNAFLHDLELQKFKRDRVENANSIGSENNDLKTQLDRKWENWKKDFLDVSNKHAPLRTVRIGQGSRCWITLDIVKLMNKRDHMKTIASKSKKADDWKQYRVLRNKVTRSIKKAKQKYYEGLTQSNLSNTKFWKEMTKLIPKKLDMSSIPKTLTLDELNIFFSEIGSKTISEAAKGKRNPGLLWKGPNCIYNFEIQHVQEEDIEFNLKKLKLTTNTDILGMDCKLLRLGSHIISKDLSVLINMSVECDMVPSDWKIARVTPIYKGNGSKEDPSNYRPISVVCHVAKVFEKVIARQFINYLTNHNLISEYQSAYLQGYSTQTSLHRIIDDIYEAMDEGEITAACFIDITKCFDSIDHGLLLDKLEKHGIKKNLGWFKSYLSQRQQRVINNGHLSESREVKSGVPQGSVLGPFLFILFANDIGNFTESGEINCYADDAVIYVTAKNGKEAENKLQRCINAIEQWYSENKLKVNVLKTEVMILGTTQKISDINEDNFSVKFGETKLRIVKEFKYLGIQLDQNLKWNNHCGKMSKKAGLKLHLMRRLSQILPKETMIQTYKTYMMPILEYAATVWGYTSEENINKIQRIINLCARIITKNYDFVNCRGEELAKELGFNTFKERRDFLLAVLMYKCHQGYAPVSLTDKLILQNQLTERETRSIDDSTYHIPRTRTKIAESAFQVKGPTVWNHLPLHIREAQNIAIFKRIYKKEILGIATWEPPPFPHT